MGGSCPSLRGREAEGPQRNQSAHSSPSFHAERAFSEYFLWARPWARCGDRPSHEQSFHRVET